MAPTSRTRQAASPDGTTTDGGTPSGRGRRRTGRSPVHTAKIAVAAVLAVLLLLFGIANSDEVPVDLLVSDASLPLILVVLGSALAGAVIAALASWRDHH